MPTKALYYILGPRGEPRVVDDVVAYAEWYVANDHIVAKTRVHPVNIVTEFVGSPRRGAPPLLFVTRLVDDDGLRLVDLREAAWRSAAVEGHQSVCEQIQDWLEGKVGLDELKAQQEVLDPSQSYGRWFVLEKIFAGC